MPQDCSFTRVAGAREEHLLQPRYGVGSPHFLWPAPQSLLTAPAGSPGPSPQQSQIPEILPPECWSSPGPLHPLQPPFLGTRQRWGPPAPTQRPSLPVPTPCAGRLTSQRAIGHCRRTGAGLSWGLGGDAHPPQRCPRQTEAPAGAARGARVCGPRPGAGALAGVQPAPASREVGKS